MLRKKFFIHPLELSLNALDLLACRGTLLMIQFHCLRTGEPSMGAIDNRGDHFQIADQFGARRRRGFLLPLRFEKQRRILQNALADCGRPPAPGGIQLPGFAGIAVMLDENRCHPLAILQALAGYRHQKPHRHLRRDLPFAYLLLDGLRQKFY